MTTELLTGTTTPEPGRGAVMPDGRIVGLRCRNCGRPEDARPELRLPGLLRAARGGLRPGARRRARRPRDDRGAAGRDLALPRAAPGRGSTGPRAPRRLHAAGRGRPDRARARDRPAVDQGRHPQPDPVVQGPGRGDRGVPGRRVRARGPGLRIDGEPRRRDSRGGGRDRTPCVRVRPGRPRAGQDRPCPGLRRDGGPDRRDVRRRQPALPRDRRRARLGVRQRQPATVLRRGQQDAGIRDRRGPRLAAARRGRRRRSPRARCSRSWPRASTSSPRSA